MLCSRYYFVLLLLHVILKYPFSWLHYASQSKNVFSIVKSPIDAANYSNVLQLFLNYTHVTWEDSSIY
jgi:hypothetical protein